MEAANITMNITNAANAAKAKNFENIITIVMIFSFSVGVLCFILGWYAKSILDCFFNPWSRDANKKLSNLLCSKVDDLIESKTYASEREARIWEKLFSNFDKVSEVHQSYSAEISGLEKDHSEKVQKLFARRLQDVMKLDEDNKKIA